MAHTGTIFLDEIGDLPIDIQSRLLRVLQEREIMRIGDDKILPIDIRLICATNKNLKQLIHEAIPPRFVLSYQCTAHYPTHHYVNVQKIYLYYWIII